MPFLYSVVAETLVYKYTTLFGRVQNGCSHDFKLACWNLFKILYNTLALLKQLHQLFKQMVAPFNDTVWHVQSIEHFYETAFILVTHYFLQTFNYHGYLMAENIASKHAKCKIICVLTFPIWHFRHLSPYLAGGWRFPDVLHCHDGKADC